MRIAMNQAPALGLHMSLLTFTAPHTIHDDLSVLKKQITDACANFWRGGPATRFKKKYGIVGNIRSFEIRYGEHGWHPHFHIIVFSEKPLPSTFKEGRSKFVDLNKQSAEWKHVLGMWQSACLRAGLRSPNEYGMDLRDGTHAGEYISKYGSDDEVMKTKKGKDVTWDMADEMTKGQTKKSDVSLAPFDFLELYGKAMEEKNDDAAFEYAKRFKQWAKASERLTMIKWSRGLKALFGFDEKEKSDEEIVAEQDDSAKFLCNIDIDSWRYIIKNKLRTLVLELAEQDDPVVKLNTFFKAHGLKRVSLKRADEKKMKLEEKCERAKIVLAKKPSENLLKVGASTLGLSSEQSTKLERIKSVERLSQDRYLESLTSSKSGGSKSRILRM